MAIIIVVIPCTISFSSTGGNSEHYNWIALSTKKTVDQWKRRMGSFAEVCGSVSFAKSLRSFVKEDAVECYQWIVVRINYDCVSSLLK